MNKIFYNTDNENLVEAAHKSGQMMTSIVMTDVGVKSAASSVISREMVEKHRPDNPNEALIHLIAMGASDYYGFNQNGDWFDEDQLEKSHGTFVTNANAYREHNSDDPLKKIGHVVFSVHDANNVHRTELLVKLSKDKAEEEFDMIRKGKELCWSMSCKVAHDICSCCGNKSRRASDYCNHLSRQMTQYIPEFQKYAYAVNIDPLFFDISRVRNPADKQARTLEVMLQNTPALQKAASARGGSMVVPSAWRAVADSRLLPTDVLGVRERATLERLADAEEFLKEAADSGIYDDARVNMMKCAAPFSLLEKFDAGELDICRRTSAPALLHQLAKRSCLLSFPAFCQYYCTEESGAVNSPEFHKAAMEILPTAFAVMRRGICSQELLDNFACASPTFMRYQDDSDDFVQEVMDSAERKFSIKAEPVRQRVTMIICNAGSKEDIKSTLEEALEKVASCSKESCDRANAMAYAYAHYQVRACMDMEDLTGEDNIGYPEYDLIVGANSTKLLNR